jgi:hypothetical protein
VALVHLLGTLLTSWYVSVASETDGQAVLVWAIWAIIDLPVSALAYQLSGFSPLVVHGVIGSTWWYFLALVVRRLLKN